MQAIQGSSSCRLPIIAWKFRCLIAPAILGLSAAIAAGAEAAASRQIAGCFQPYYGELATLAPDGRRLAFLSTDSRDLKVVIFDLADGYPKTEVALRWTSTGNRGFFNWLRGVGASADMDSTWSGSPVFLGWAAPDRLILASDEAAIFVIDAQAGTAKRAFDGPSYAQSSGEDDVSLRPPRFLGLAPDDPDWALVEVVNRVESVADLMGMFDSSDGGSGDQGSGDAADLSGESGGGFGGGGEDGALGGSGDSLGGVGAGGSAGLLGWVTKLDERRRVFEVLKVNLLTGATKSLADVTGNHNDAVLYDRQGMPRLIYVRNAVPQVFRYHPPTRPRFWARWRTLDDLSDPRAALGFNVAPKNFLGQRSIPLTFGPDPDILYFASNIGRETYALCALDVKTMTAAEVVSVEGYDLADLDAPLSDSALVFDRDRKTLVGVRFLALQPRTRWLDPEIGAVQAAVEEKFPGRAVQLNEWDDRRERFLAWVGSSQDAGRYFIYDRTLGHCVEYARRAPWLSLDEADTTTPFECTTPAGIRLGGQVTIPHATRITPPPLIVHMHDGPWRRPEVGFDREIHALAAMGCIVLQVDYRGSGGQGWRHASPGPGALEESPLEDAIAGMQWLADRHPFNRRRVAIMGEGFGGFLALRAIELHPELFRCAIMINAPTDPGQMYEPQVNIEEAGKRMDAMRAMMSGRMDLLASEPPPEVDFAHELQRWLVRQQGSGVKALSAGEHAERIHRPVFIIHDGENKTVSVQYARALQRALKRRSRPVEFLEVSAAFTDGDPYARLPAYQQINEFFNEHLYDYRVDVGVPVPRE